MPFSVRFSAALVAAVFLISGVAWAECAGGLGRGWASGKGNGQFSMSAKDKTCLIGYGSFIDDATNARTPATDIVVTKSPKNGKVGVDPAKGLIYTPNVGFKGDDKFCTKSTSPTQKGQSLKGCVTVSVS